MKKLLILITGAIAVIIALSFSGPLIGLAFSGLLIYLAMHYYVKTNSVISKVFWIFIGLIGALTAITNVPALIGLAAITIAYLLYKKWKNEDISLNSLKEEDPFTNFESEWAKLSK